MIHDSPEGFLGCPTPAAWLDRAQCELEILLIDHAHCEQKAASTAIGFIYKYPQQHELCMRMSKLAREELRHYEQVRRIMKQRNIEYRRVPATRYAKGLLDEVEHCEVDPLVAKLLIGAIIEARSCERFAALAPLLDEELGVFYHSLYAAERRHFTRYLEFAQQYSTTDTASAIERLLKVESSLISGHDVQFGFHSGIPLS